MAEAVARRLIDFRAKPVIFIHGANYRTAPEVMRDFVDPFSAAALPHCPKVCADSQVYIVHWTSDLMETLTASRMVSLAFNLSEHISRSELIAWRCSRKLAENLATLFASHSKAPLFISHSMGALLLAHALGRLVRSGRTVPVGTAWWSLQPYLARDAYACGSQFAFIPRLFTRRGGRHAVWYSKKDFILRAAASFGPRRTVMGLIGAQHASVEATDTTAETQEAHGSITLWSSKGNFFKRLEKMLRTEFARFTAPEASASA